MFENTGVMTHLVGLMMLSMIVQVVTQNIKRVIGDQYSGTISILVGIIVAFVAQASVLNKIGFEVQWPLADQILTGLFIAGGSSVIYEALSRNGLAKKPVNCKKNDQRGEGK